MQILKTTVVESKRRSKDWSQAAACLLLCLLISSCSTKSHRLGAEKEPERLGVLSSLCAQGRSLKSASGSMWFKVRSKDMSGQFPASVEVESGKDLKIEITDLVGGPVALVKMDSAGKQLEMQKSGQKTLIFSQEWNGIPLWWIHALVLGRFPCPRVDKAVTHWVDDTTLEAREGTWTYRYGMTTFSGRPWAKSLEAVSEGRTISFVFESPDAIYGIPLKWEAVSAIGEIKIRWRDRENRVTSQ